MAQKEEKKTVEYPPARHNNPRGTCDKCKQVCPPTCQCYKCHS